MKPGDLVRITRFDEVPYVGVYLGPSKRFDEGRMRWEGRFLLNNGVIRDFDVGNNLVWRFEVFDHIMKCDGS